MKVSKFHQLLRYPPLHCVMGMAAAALFEEVRHDFWWGIGVLGGLICLYGWAAKGEKNENRQVVGDNCYFIGFVYTLTVVALALAFDVELAIVKNATGEGVNSVLKTVAIALGTSVIGMLWRFGLIYGVKVPQNEYDIMVAKAAVATDRLEAAINAVESSAGHVEKSFLTVDSAAQSYATHIRNEVERVGDGLGESAVKLFDTLGNRITDTLHKMPLDDVSEDMREAVEAHRAVADDISKILQQSTAALRESAKTAAETAEKTSEALNALNSAAAAVEEQASGSATMASEALRDSIGEHFRTAATDLATNMRQINEGLQVLAERQKELVENTGGDIERLGEVRDGFNRLIEELRESSAATVSEVSAARRGTEGASAEATVELTRALENITVRLEKISEQLERTR